MQSVEAYEKTHGKLWDDPESVQKYDLLSKLIEKSKSKDKPLIVKNVLVSMSWCNYPGRSFKSSY